MNFVRPCLIEEDNGLADMEAGYLGSNHWQSHKQQGFFSRFLCYTRNRNISDNYSINIFFSVSTNSSSKPRFETSHQSYFLNACFLCKKPLRSNEDMFMYRGDTPFCSVECRYKQIVIDEINEKKFEQSVSVKALRKKKQRKSSFTNAAIAHGYPPFRTSSTIAAA